LLEWIVPQPGSVVDIRPCDWRLRERQPEIAVKDKDATDTVNAKCLKQCCRTVEET
jgi:hypothetical protein